MMALQKSSVKTKTLRGFELSTVIGKGSYGEVWLARHTKDQKQYVLKKINLKSASEKERRAAEQEALLLSKLKHPNIVTYKDSFQAGERHLYIAMQYCEGGDLYTWLKELKGKVLEERQIVEWFIQIAMALQYLHERDILHRDLKTQNIFLTKNKIIKVGDLGIARVLENSSDMATTLIGTPYYMSPELFSSQPYNQKSDVWALGCCVYEMTTLRHAFNARDMNSLAFKILSGKLPPMPRLYTNELVSLIQSMLHQEPSRRPSVNKLLRSPYVKKCIVRFLEETRQNRRPLPPSPGKALKSVPSSSSSSSSSSSVPPSSDGVNKNNISNRERRRKKLISNGDQLDSGRVKEILDKKTPGDDNEKESSGDNSAHPEEEAKVRQPIAASPSSVTSEEIFESPRSSASSSSTESSLTDSSSTLANSSQSHTQDTVIAKTIVQQSKSEEPVKVNKKKPKSKSLSCGDAQQPVSENHLMPKNSVERVRPLPPPPKLDKSSREPQQGISLTPCSFSSSSSSKDCSANLGEGEAPKSLPNELARQKRRAKKQSAYCSMERPDSARIELKRPPVVFTPLVVNNEKSDQSEEVSEIRRPAVLHHRQPSMSIEDYDDNISLEESSKETQDKEDKEMKTLAKFLNTTLQNNASKNYDDKSDDESRVLPDLTPHQQQHPAPVPQLHREERKSEDSDIQTFASPETLVHTKRLSDRISILEKDCESGIGKEILQQAVEILDKFEDEEVEPHLQELLGEEKFARYAGKIWQLKFCKQMSV